MVGWEQSGPLLNTVDRHMGEVINLNKYRRDRKRVRRQTTPAVIPAKIEPKDRGLHEEDVRQLEFGRESSTAGVLSLPQPSAKKDGPKKDEPETA